MRRLFLLSTAAVSLFAMGCYSPESVCETKVETTCNKVYECVPEQARGTAEFKSVYGTSLDECKTLQTTYLKCGSIENYDELCNDGVNNGKEYELGKASDCSEETKKQACEDFNAKKRPEVCSQVCK